MSALNITVAGTPAAQGSKRPVRNQHTGRIQLVETSKRLPTWRDDVRAAAEKELDRYAFESQSVWWAAPLQVTIQFRLARPKSHYRTGRNAHLLHHVGALTYRVSDDKARARDTFLAHYWVTDTPCKAEPDRWHSESLAVRNQAERDCRTCPLLALCNAWASADPPEKWGVWGGRDRAKKVKKGNK